MSDEDARARYAQLEEEAERIAAESAARMQAEDAARELSNPENRRGYRRTAALAATVAAYIGQKLEHAKDDPEIARSTLDDLDEIEKICRAMAGVAQ
jgi:ferric-dicitrate binding protein FerR (iron transport regulator)